MQQLMPTSSTHLSKVRSDVEFLTHNDFIRVKVITHKDLHIIIINNVKPTLIQMIMNNIMQCVVSNYLRFNMLIKSTIYITV